jgi:hypothetical protein
VLDERIVLQKRSVSTAIMKAWKVPRHMSNTREDGAESLASQQPDR